MSFNYSHQNYRHQLNHHHPKNDDKEITNTTTSTSKTSKANQYSTKFNSKQSYLLKPTNNSNQYSNQHSNQHSNPPNIDKKGVFTSVPQTIFKPINEPATKNLGELIMKEEIEGFEIVPNKIYEFNLGHDKFIEFLKPYKDQSTKYQVIDNYYLYHYVYSIKNNKKVAYQEEMIDGKWTGTCYLRTLKRTYLPDPFDLDCYRDYHLIVRIIRFQIDHQIYEIIIPTINSSPYEVNDNFWTNLFDDQYRFPKNTKFVIRRQAK